MNTQLRILLLLAVLALGIGAVSLHLRNAELAARLAATREVKS